MQDFLNKAGKTAGAAVNKVGNKASELIEVSKLKAKISSEKQDISNLKKDIGEYCYSLFADGQQVDDNIREYCEKISACEVMIEELQQHISDVKERYRSGSEGNDADDSDDI